MIQYNERTIHPTDSSMHANEIYLTKSLYVNYYVSANTGLFLFYEAFIHLFLVRICFSNHDLP